MAEIPSGLDWRERNAWLEENGRQCRDCAHVRANGPQPYCAIWSERRPYLYTVMVNQAPWCHDFKDQEASDVCRSCGR